MFVYVVSLEILYENSILMGVFSDYVKAREFMMIKSMGDEDAKDYVITKVELDRNYRFGSVGEEV